MTNASFAFVSTNSICQGKAVSSLWPTILGKNLEISFAYTSFKWSNLANYNAGVTVVIVGVTSKRGSRKRLFVSVDKNLIETREVAAINAYLVAAQEIYIEPRGANLSGLNSMVFGNMPIDGGFLSFTRDEIETAKIPEDTRVHFIKRIYGGAEYVRGLTRYCLWVHDDNENTVREIPKFEERFRLVRKFRLSSKRPATYELADMPHRFGWIAQTGNEVVTLLPRILSERRGYIAVGHEPAGTLTTDQAYALNRPGFAGGYFA